MKKSLIYIAAVFVIAFTSCSKGFLEKAPISNANSANFYKTEADFKLAVNGAYASLTASGIFHDNVQLIGELRSDNATMGSTASSRVYYIDMSEFREQSASPISQSAWNDHYGAIARCNIITSRINGVPMSEDAKNRILAETRFLRGLYYFNLVRIFGDVPLVLQEITTTQTAYQMGRTATSEVYKSIEEDLLFAADHLPDNYATADKGRATSGAARGLLGKVYLTEKKYNEAVTALQTVINSGKYQLLGTFGNLWNTANKNSLESLFEVQFRKTAEANVGSSYSARYTPYLSGAALLGFESSSGGYNTPTEQMLTLYGSTDKRKEFSVAASYTATNGQQVTGLTGRHTRKFLGKPTNGQGAEDNWPVLRYADVLLMYAEALNEVSFQGSGAAFEAINAVRSRAGLGNLSSTTNDAALLVSNQAEFRLAVERERRWELAFEGHRWFDLVRTGRAMTVLQAAGKNIKPHQLLLPIPQEQIDINPGVIKQNEGY
jgi:hypothetical protein